MRGRWWPWLAGTAAAGVSLSYPWIVLGLYGNSPLLVVLWVAVLGVWLLTGREPSAKLRAAIFCAAVMLAALALAGPVSGQALAKFYPVIISMALLVVFAGSLMRPPSVIERAVRRSGRQVPAQASRYMRWVTIVWVVFFAVNGALAAWLAVFGAVQDWALYNGLVSYLIIGAIMGLELAIRRWYRSRYAGDGSAASPR